MEKWKVHCLQRYRLQHPNRVKLSGLHPTTRSNRPEIPCLPRFLPVYKEKQPGLEWLKHPNKVIQPGIHQQHARTGWSNQAFSVYGTHKGGSNRASTQPHAPTNHLNAVFTQSLTAVQGDATQRPPTFSIHQKRTTHPLSSSPHEKEPPSLLPTSTPQQSRTDQSKKPVPSFRTTIRSQWTFTDLTPM